LACLFSSFLTFAPFHKSEWEMRAIVLARLSDFMNRCPM
jgi:hypothetical protein